MSFYVKLRISFYRQIPGIYGWISMNFYSEFRKDGGQFLMIYENVLYFQNVYFFASKQRATMPNKTKRSQD